MKRLNWVSSLLVGRRSVPHRRHMNRKVRLTSTRRSTFENLEERALLATLTVNSPLDNLTGGDGLVTLREAIVAANSNSTTDLGQSGSGADTIQFDPVVFATPHQLGLAFGAFLVSETLTINGPGQNLLTIDAHLSSRIFDITSGSTTIDGITLINGRATGIGGAIRFVSSGSTLALNHCVISGNSATDKGG